MFGLDGLSFFENDIEVMRIEAGALFERCLTEGRPDPLLNFIEAQVYCEPPRSDVLQWVAEDLHQRLIGLREYHLDVRDRVLRAVRVDYGVDLGPLMPANSLAEYHLLRLDFLMDTISVQQPGLGSREVMLVRGLLEASLDITSQLYADISMTEQLLECAVDWADALNVMEARQARRSLWDSPDLLPLQ